MERITFTLNGKLYTLSRDQVIKAMRGQIPGPIQVYSTDIEGERFPVKQVIASALQVPSATFISTRAREWLGKLDFPVFRDDGSPVPAANLDAAADETDDRRLALELAVRWASTMRTGTVDEVLDAAERFQRWLGAD